MFTLATCRLNITSFVSSGIDIKLTWTKLLPGNVENVGDLDNFFDGVELGLLNAVRGHKLLDVVWHSKP